MDLTEHTVGAVKDWNKRLNGQFNAGVLLLNLERCRKEQFTETLIAYTEQHYSDLKDGDQTVLNHFYPDYLALPKKYNTQVGVEWLGGEVGEMAEPTVVHYSTHQKPWKTYSHSRLRELWWVYHNLEWSDLVGYWKVKNADVQLFTTYSQQKCFVLTNSDNIEKLEELIQAFPNLQFMIAARTIMSPKLLNLAAYPNVFVYPNILPFQIEELLDQTSIYLDINHYSEVDSIVERAYQKGKKILTFEHTKHREERFYDAIVPSVNPEQMIDCLREVVSE
ncbi:glycosyltransferase [Streptococcus himalayensis]|nr:glycosyltransferase [Streptococcus himalayensis]